MEFLKTKAMWRAAKSFIILLAAGHGLALGAQSYGPITGFIGAADIEELPPYDMELLEDMLQHPLMLNCVSESRLEESGLFSRYQVASLCDYRLRHGDVLSFTELAALDGFGHDFVMRLRPFVSLESYRLPSSRPYKSVRNDISVRTAFRKGSGHTYGLKYRLTCGERLSGGIAVSRTSGATSMVPEAFSGHLAYNFRRKPGKIIIGDFNARFGQGLALWNGMGFNGLGSAASFMKKPSSISASSSFTGSYSLRGLAADIRLGPSRLSVLTAVSRNKDTLSILPAVNLSWFMRNGRFSLTHYAEVFMSGIPSIRIPDMKTSADMAYCIRGIDIFAEAAYDWVSSETAALAGIVIPAGTCLRLASMLRCYPPSYRPMHSAAARSTTRCTNEHAASFAADFTSDNRKHLATVSVDCAYFPHPKAVEAAVRSMQIKTKAQWTCIFNEVFAAVIKYSGTIRTWGDPFRNDIRLDFKYESNTFYAALRLNALKCRKAGFLAYAEEGYHNESLSVYFRQGIFRIDNWADRIYVYERDAPGSYNVPAYYGRGVWAALAVNWKFARWGRIYARAAATGFPFMTEKKPGRAELKFQTVFTF